MDFNVFSSRKSKTTLFMGQAAVRWGKISNHQISGDATTFLKSFLIATVSEIHCLADPSLLTSFFVWAEATFYHIQTFKYLVAVRRWLFGLIHFIIQVPFWKLNFKMFSSNSKIEMRFWRYSSLPNSTPLVIIETGVGVGFLSLGFYSALGFQLYSYPVQI